MTLIKKSIDLATAQQAVAAAAKKAAELGLKMCIAVSDESGDLKAFARMDGAPSCLFKLQRTRRTRPLRMALRPMSGLISSRTIHRCSTGSPTRLALSCSAEASQSCSRVRLSGRSASAADIISRIWNAAARRLRRLAPQRSSEHCPG